MSKCGWLALVAVVLVLSRVCAGGQASVRKPRPAPQAAPPAPAIPIGPVEVVEGVGKAAIDAVADGERKAQARIERRLREQFDGANKLFWPPPVRLIEISSLKKLGAIAAVGEPIREARGGESVFVARFKVALTTTLSAATADALQKSRNGFGPDRDKAISVATSNAKASVEQTLRERFHLGEDALPPGLVDLESLDRAGVITLDGETRPDPEQPSTIGARYTIALTPDFLKRVELAVRTESMKDRHPVLLRLLGGMVVLLLVTTGYLRLEEMTRGYATALLRAAAAMIMLLTGLGLFLTF